MKRRVFLGTATGGFSALWESSLSRLLAAEAEKLPDGLFESPDPAVLKLAGDVYQQCILGKVFPPKGVLTHRWIGPGGGYNGQWIWDTMFVVDLLSILSGREELIREVFRNYWDFQARWNREMPEYARDMVACMINPDDENWVKFPAYSQIPILAWGVERVYQRNGDKELLRQCLGPIERFHEWYWRERDVTDIGLVTVGAYRGGAVQDARWETFDYECNLDELKLTRHPARKGEKEGEWYGDICVPGNSAYLILGERCLMRLAEVMGDHGMAARRKSRIDKAVEAMRKHMWDEAAGLFLSVNRDTLEKIPVGTIGSWIPLTAGVPTEAMAKRMAETLRTPGWNTPLPVPTVDRNDRRWTSDGRWRDDPTARSNRLDPKLAQMWRGDVWPATNYQIASGLAAYGYKDLAAEIADRTVANAIQNGISEHYDSVSGKALGVPYLGMTCSIITMMLDGLCRKHQLHLKKAK
jgi:putative isomerase